MSDLIIATVERIVDRVEKSADGIIAPAPTIQYIALAPRGAWPTSCYPNYPVGGGELMRYVDACNAGEFEDYLAQMLKTNPAG